MARIAFIGAGSVVFAKNVIADMLWHDSLKDCTLALMDIDEDRLDAASALATSLNHTLGAEADIIATTDRREALDGADFVINTTGVGGFDATRIDHEIPSRFGMRQTIADTLGPGGVFRSVRSIPVLLDICRDMRTLCPDAWLLNYANPMATHCLAVARATDIRCVGLCHGVRNTARAMRMYVAMLQHDPDEIMSHFDLPGDDPQRIEQWLQWWELGVDPALSYTCAGINHMAFFLDFRSGQTDLYPDLHRMLDMPHMERLDPVRFEMFRRLGYFMTETSWHTAEYVPYFLKDEAETRRRHVTVSSYLETCRQQDAGYQDMKRRIHSGEPLVDADYSLSVEYAAPIMNAMLTNVPFVFNGNVHNRGGQVISNVQGDSCVEGPCTATRQGVRPAVVGDLPPQCAALIRTNINVQDLTVRAILEGDRQTLRQAVMMDPNTAASLTLPDIWDMCDALFAAHEAYLPPTLR